MDAEEPVNQVSTSRCFSKGMEVAKANFIPYLLVVIILSIITSMAEIDKNNATAPIGYFFWGSGMSAGLFGMLIAIFIKPVFEYGANLLFARGNRGEYVEVKDIVHGFRNKNAYIDILLTNLLVFFLVLLGFICLILPGFFIYSRLVLTSYLVVDKNLGPREAVAASWDLTRRYWPSSLALMIMTVPVCIIGLLLFVVGIFPAMIWIKTWFAAFYQQILDAHDEQTLRSLDIAP